MRRRMRFRLIAALILWPMAAVADVELRLSFAYLEGAALPAPDLTVTNLYAQTPVEVLAPEAAPEGTVERVLVLKDGDFTGPYARLRLAVAGLHLPPEDARADRDLAFAFEMIVNRDRVADKVLVKVPVITSSRKGAMKSALAEAPIAEEVAGRFFLAQQYMAAYQATDEAVAAAPGSFALHRLITRALADFALALTDQRGAGVQILPAVEMARDITRYWKGDAEGRKQHMRAWSDARTMMWRDLSGVEDTLRAARRAGVETVQRCAEATRVLDFFETVRPPKEDARKVDLIFPNPGSLDGYLAGRRLDVKFICSRPKI